MPKNAHNDLSETIYLWEKEEGREQGRDHGLRQDNSAKDGARVTSGEPSSSQTVIQAEREFVQQANVYRHHARAVQITLWVRPTFKREIERIAKAEGLSVSKTGASLLERSLQTYVDMQFSSFLVPVIEKVVRVEMRKITERLATLLVRVAFDTGQIRSISTNILSRQPGLKEEALRAILEDSYKTARSNIASNSPQFKEFLREVKKFLDEELDNEQETLN